MRPRALLGLAVLVVAGVPCGASKTGFAVSPQNWCFDTPGANRTDDSAGRLNCGTCEGVLPPVACVESADCPAAEACVDAREEVVWWDARFDAAVNDVRTLATTQDAFAVYFYLDFWAYPDPLALPFGQLAIDFQPGGSHELIDPSGAMVAPGVCSDSPDRACTTDEDCHFCLASFELPQCCNEGTCECEETCRVRICGSGCEYGDACDTTQTCEGLGTRSLARVGLGSNPPTRADYLLVLDLSRFLYGFAESVQLNRWEDAWSPIAEFGLFVPPACCTQHPEPSVQLGVPWSAFGCVDWTDQEGCGSDPTAAGCGCPDFGPGTEFGFTFAMARAVANLDYLPDGAIEDVSSEAFAGATTLTTDDCPMAGVDATLCEIADGSLDAFLPRRVSQPGGTTAGLTATTNLEGPSPAITLRWGPSCSSADTDYAVYEGDLRSFPAYDHQAVQCITSGATTATFTVQAGDRYYLVVPTNGLEDGSYGSDGNGAQRPVSHSPCRPQAETLSCP